MAKWQPIKTAPIGGTPFLAAKQMWAGYWAFVVVKCVDDKVVVTWDGDIVTGFFTHWKPIKPPKE
jgi:hypothetical protein